MVVPPTFETTEVLAEDEAKEIRASLLAESPKFQLVEWIRLRETLDKMGLHEQLISKIHACNQHIDTVTYAEYCERCNDFDTKEQDEDRMNLAKKTNVVH